MSCNRCGALHIMPPSFAAEPMKPLRSLFCAQGHCGSCWALAATGSLEASVARKAASEAYEEYMASSGTSDQRTTTTRENDSVDFSSFFNAGFARKTLRYQQQQQQTEAVAQAQQVELETFQNLKLSIQELLDCDTTVDRGCIGGNPLLAFPFIHQYGLVDWREYPYIGARTPTARAGSPSSTTTTTTPGGGLWSAARTGSLSSCQFNRSQPAVATSHSWGRIPPNHEPSMEWALRYIGPIAVGIHGEAPSFLSYQGGVYSDVQCNTTALNHALLVVGYGQETVVLRHRHKHQIDPIISASTTNNKNKKKTSHTKIVKYWIARNSWGTGWGEGGFVRIQRRGESMDGYTTAGVCGIARNPSVALGGKLLVPLSSLTSSFSPLLNLSEHEDDGRVDSSKALHTLVPLNSYRSGEAGPYPSCNHILEPQNQEGDYSSLWDRALTTLAFSSCRFHELMAQHPGFWFMCVILGSCAIVVALVVWPLTFDCRQRRQRRLRQRQRRLEEQQLQHDSEERKQEQFSELEEKEKNGRDSGEPPAQSFVSLSSSITSHERGGDGVVNEETPLLQPRH